MLVYKKQISESFVGGTDAGPYEQSFQEDEEPNNSDEYVVNDDNVEYYSDKDDQYKYKDENKGPGKKKM